jgi:hypothetical protein
LEGTGLRAMIGDRVGDAVTFTIGETVGLTVGGAVTATVGETVGLAVGDAVTATVGETVGLTVGGAVFFTVGEKVGLTVGIIECGPNDKEKLAVGVIECGPNDKEKLEVGENVEKPDEGHTVDDGLSDSAGEKEEPGDGANDTVGDGVGKFGLEDGGVGVGIAVAGIVDGIVDETKAGIVDGIVDETKDEGFKLAGTNDGPEEVANRLVGDGVGRGVIVSGKNKVTAWVRKSLISTDSQNVMRPFGTLVQSAVYLSFPQYEQVRHCSPFTVTIQSNAKVSETVTMLDGGSGTSK